MTMLRGSFKEFHILGRTRFGIFECVPDRFDGSGLDEFVNLPDRIKGSGSGSPLFTGYSNGSGGIRET